MEIKKHTTVKWFFVSAAAWFALGTTAGFIDATHMMAPDLLDNIPFLVFGRIRPMHTNLVIFGFVGTMLLAASHYILPTLCKSRISERLGLLPWPSGTALSLRVRSPWPWAIPREGNTPNGSGRWT
ncbi:MAG: cbb3-type cytochrome c oxidase subunit I [Syntrophobacteraceae bacterium]